MDLARLKHVHLMLVGRHGGATRIGKLEASIQRIGLLTGVVSKFSPDLAISFCSPEAARVAFGLGINHVVFSDSPHAEAVMRLALPFAQKLLIPWIIPKKEFVRYGISGSDIIQYRAVDAAVIVKGGRGNTPAIRRGKRKTVVIRVEESAAAYSIGRKNTSHAIISEFAKEGDKYQILVLTRYKDQAEKLRCEFGQKLTVLGRVVEGRSLLLSTSLFIGSGGTMTAEAALMGIPTISYDAVPNYIEKYLVRTGLAKRETNPKKIMSIARRMLENGTDNRSKARKVLDSMEDPYPKLLAAIRSL